MKVLKHIKVICSERRIRNYQSIKFIKDDFNSFSLKKKKKSYFSVFKTLTIYIFLHNNVLYKGNYCM